MVLASSLSGNWGAFFYYDSPNLKTNLIGKITDWGTGQDAIINIELIVEKDCKINAQNINFGTAPLVSKFNPITGTVQISLVLLNSLYCRSFRWAKL